MGNEPITDQDGKIYKFYCSYTTNKGDLKLMYRCETYRTKVYNDTKCPANFYVLPDKTIEWINNVHICEESLPIKITEIFKDVKDEMTELGLLLSLEKRNLNTSQLYLLTETTLKEKYPNTNLQFLNYNVFVNKIKNSRKSNDFLEDIKLPVHSLLSATDKRSFLQLQSTYIINDKNGANQCNIIVWAHPELILKLNQSIF